LVLRGTRLPTTRVNVFTTAADNQQSVELNVLLGESGLAADCISLGKFHLKGIAPAKKGQAEIKVSFNVDEACKVQARASVEGTALDASDDLVPKPEYLSDETIAKLRKKGENSKAKVSLIEARLEAEKTIDTAEALLDGAISSSKAERISEDIAALGEALQAEDLERIQRQTIRLKDNVDEGKAVGFTDAKLFDEILGGFFTQPYTPPRTQQRTQKTPTQAEKHAPPSSGVRAEEVARTTTRLPLGRIFGGGEFMLDATLCFVLMPFAETFQPIYEDTIKPSIQRQGLRCLRADEIRGTNLITRDIWEMINRARIIIADLTDQNPNVFYEVGLAHAIGKDVLLLTQTMTDVPFDMKTMRCIVYSYTPRGMKELEEALTATVSALVTSGDAIRLLRGILSRYSASMPSTNRAFLIGTVTRTPTFHQTSRGAPFCTFDLQLDPTRRGDPCIMRVVIFGRQAEPAARHLGRGSEVFVAGHLAQRERVTQEVRRCGR
jgi:primosomal replication protein N